MKSAKTTLFDKTDTPTAEHDEIMMRFIEVDEKYNCLLNRLYWLQKDFRVWRAVLGGMSFNQFSILNTNAGYELSHTGIKDYFLEIKRDNSDMAMDKYFTKCDRRIEEKDIKSLFKYRTIESKNVIGEENTLLGVEIEYPIMQGNKTSTFYLGTVDLMTSYAKDVRFTIDGCEDNEPLFTDFIIEIKPKIESISAVIRQLKVYYEYIQKEHYEQTGALGKLNAVILTGEEYKTTLYSKMLESQNIMMVNIDDFEELGKVL